MWGRVIEMTTAVWLALSPYIFRAQDNPTLVWVDSLVALLIVILSSLSYWRPTNKLHLGNLLVATGLCLYGRFAGEMPPLPEHQNHLAVGFFLMMMAIIPNYSSQPPIDWRRPVPEPR